MSNQTKKKTTAKSPPTHPPFKEMICDAVKACPDKKGASRQSIRNYVAANNQVSETVMKGLKTHLKRLLEKGVLVHPTNAPARFKLAKPKAAEGAKKKKATNAPAKKAAPKKKPVAKKADAAKKVKGKKTPVKKTAAAKKTTVKKVAAKKPAAKRSPKKAAKKPAKKAAPKRK
jgi:histone H1/5